MITEIKQHKYEYSILFLYTILSVVMFLGYQQNWQRFIVIILYSGFYFSWSLIHHLINKNLTLIVLLEYLLITILALVSLKVIFFPNL
ncbi:hypothetical protein A2313_01950 [Candidatus Roizmanbacteria bacterium RIFOXYB2_FULL_41_10]|uniref:Uncharacterized protein n=1 Tax=Candidatus Roizmanbacteria bacterium RIFOXYA1_FULL_41_12 TaxID=1802082 RepID=A0A1F7KA36_9BACT|nr:MAG: hypothetical protein A2209_00200 [Candidatus Roizmanbacteria bacterium RIFOXYA1_FULL_41_12]OGK66694.1 MAG: hypothetical protein A2262_03595 [Candidatus Roizmanbacteria bacterium RIFOXYA2_FULL_41_8]OGK67551.1 MAG: hypothetical protein A2377_01755 [Candidatus Roizmanbacteria bacterium RIFOXYB1_FULL_41_27]OGK70957.1 MAG: hypothetical protein A2313_01950 [Candidatus Roizmanbacteria bacterium RIFOXYB2_FULL_41_10]OGK71207.1 MAG: hypothetical protein A2403_00485 [Candidatus Roizmanbacteria bac